MRTWIPKAREKIRVAWAQAVFEDLTDLLNKKVNKEGDTMTGDLNLSRKLNLLDEAGNIVSSFGYYDSLGIGTPVTTLDLPSYPKPTVFLVRGPTDISNPIIVLTRGNKPLSYWTTYANEVNFGGVSDTRILRIGADIEHPDIEIYRIPPRRIYCLTPLLLYGFSYADPPGVTEGFFWYRSDLKRLRYHDGTAVRDVSRTAGETMVDLTVINPLPIRAEFPAVRLESPTGTLYGGIYADATTTFVESKGNEVAIAPKAHVLGNLTIDGYVKIPATANLLGRVYDGSLKTVVETTFTLKDEVLPAEPKSVLYPKHVVIDFNNPTDSGVFLDYELRLFHSDKSETVVLSKTGIPPGSSGADDIIEEVLADAYKDGVSVVAVRLYAKVSATPPAGYEPTVRCKLRGVQF